jgi:hypothetical protein
MDTTALAELLDGADDTERGRVWRDLVDDVGMEDASRLWLAYFAATDAPVTG